MEECIFCKIVNDEIPRKVVFENEDALALLDTVAPVSTGHTLVIPKTHSRNILDIDTESWVEIMKTVRKLAPIIMEAMDADGINIGMNNEKAAGQVIFHPHVHLIPRFEGDGFHQWKRTNPKEDNLDEVQKKIIESMTKLKK